jgi:hypothetical protein
MYIVIYFYGGLVPIAVHTVLQFKKQETMAVDIDMHRISCPLELIQSVPFWMIRCISLLQQHPVVPVHTSVPTHNRPTVFWADILAWLINSQACHKSKVSPLSSYPNEQQADRIFSSQIRHATFYLLSAQKYHCKSQNSVLQKDFINK